MLFHHLKQPKSPLFPSQFRNHLFSTLQLSQTTSHFPSSERICSTLSFNSLHKFLFQSRKYLQSVLLFKKTPFTQPSQNDPFIFPSLLRSCTCLHLLDLGIGLHGYLIKSGLVNWVNVSDSLLKMYFRLGDKNSAFQVFDEMPLRSEEFCNSAICCFGYGGFFALVLDVLELMLNSGFYPSRESVRYVIMACGELRRLEKGMWVHEFVRENKFDGDVVVGNLLISMYVRIGRLDLARCTFDSMSDKDVVSWNSIINGYAQKGNSVATFNVFQLMKEAGNVSPNEVTLLGLVLACGDAENLDQGKSLHGHCIKTALLSESRLGTAIVNMYANCNCIEYAEAAFEESSFQKSLVTWNSLIFGYSQNGYYQKAVVLFQNMISSEFKPDSVTFSNVLHAYSNLGNLEAVQTVHGLITKKGFEIGDDFVLGTSMVDAYGKCLGSAAALSLFASIKHPNVATWNTLIGAFLVDHQPEMGMLYFLKMIKTETSPDSITILAVLQLCGELGSLKQATMVHTYSLSKGFSSNLDVQNAKIVMYIKCGSVENAQELFNLAPLRNVVSWNTILSGLAKRGDSTSVVSLFTQMLLENKTRPNTLTLLPLIQACGCVHGVSMAHSLVLKLGLEADTPVMNSLIDAYAKSGMIEDGSLLFLQMGHFRDQCSWNVMISGYGMNSQGTKACKLLAQMEEEEDGFKPDSITFVSLLSACSHSGLINEGCKYFDLMVNNYKIEPSHEHWTCIIDLFGRAGRLEDAYQLVINGLSQKLKGDAIWGALMDACRMNNNSEIGEFVGEKLMENAPLNCGYHTLLSNFYASNNNWDEVDKVRRVFENRLTKKPGISKVLA